MHGQIMSPQQRYGKNTSIFLQHGHIWLHNVPLLTITWQATHDTWTGKTLLNLAEIRTTKHLVQNARHYFPIVFNVSQLPRQFQEFYHTTAYHFMQRPRARLVITCVTLAPDDSKDQKLMRTSYESMHDHNVTVNDHSHRVWDNTIHNHDADKHEMLLKMRSVSNSTLASKVISVSDENLG
jgi:hypothetical protein